MKIHQIPELAGFSLTLTAIRASCEVFIDNQMMASADDHLASCSRSPHLMLPDHNRFGSKKSNLNVIMSIERNA